LTYLVIDLRSGLQCFGGAFFTLFCDPRSPIGSMLDLGHSCVFDAWRGISTAYFPGDTALRGVPADAAVVAFGDSMSPSPSSTSMDPMSELIMVMSADTANLVRFLFFSSPPWPGSRLGRRNSSPSSAPYAMARRPWMAPCVMWQEPCRRSPPLSRRRTHRWEVSAPLACPLRRGPCSCAGPRRAVVPGTSRCPRGATKQEVEIQLEPTPKM
jgi:hypothetical protein